MWTAGVFRVSEDEAQAMGKLKAESVRLENGDVVLSLNVYQELYCIVCPPSFADRHLLRV